MTEFYNGEEVRYKGYKHDVFYYIGLNPKLEGYSVVCRKVSGSYLTVRTDEIESV